MATINAHTSKTGQTTYRVRVQKKGYPTQTATFPSLREARRWATMIEGQIAEGRHFPQKSTHTLSELITRYIADVMPHKTSTNQRWRPLCNALLVTSTPHRHASIRRMVPALASVRLVTMICARFGPSLRRFCARTIVPSPRVCHVARRTKPQEADRRPSGVELARQNRPPPPPRPAAPRLEGQSPSASADTGDSGAHDTEAQGGP